MKMYKNNWQGIIEVEVERKSESSVWINGRRNALRSSYENYFAAPEECKAFMLREAEAVLKMAEGRVEYARKKVAEIMAIEPNVRGQRTRHLVAGTLDPLVQCHFLPILGSGLHFSLTILPHDQSPSTHQYFRSQTHT